MNLDEIEYSTKPYTLRDLIMAENTARGSWTAMLAYILSRTNLTQEQALYLDTEELSIISQKLLEAAKNTVTLIELGKALD